MVFEKYPTYISKIILIVFHFYMQSHHLNNGFTKETDSDSQIPPKKTKLKIIEFTIDLSVKYTTNAL